MTPVAMTIAGSDPSGGAGLQADLKTFHQHGVYGTSIVTLLTVQNTWGVAAVEILNPDFVVAQFDAVVNDIPPRAARTQLQHRGGSWMVAARQGVRLARQAIEEADRKGRCAVAFSINGDIVQPQHVETLELLTRVLKSDPPRPHLDGNHDPHPGRSHFPVKNSVEPSALENAG